MMTSSSYKRADDDEGSDATKSVTDLGLGLTQVLGRRTVLSLNYTNSRVAGYQTDPYKIVSVVDGVTGAPAPVSGDPTRDLYLYESRPDNRVKNAIAAELIRSLGRDVVTLSYRYFDDDWGITSHTGELHYRLNFAKGRYFQPNVRWYHQTEADFYRRWLVEGEAPRLRVGRLPPGRHDGDDLRAEVRHHAQGRPGAVAARGILRAVG
jgi:hypothetical protein